jgi:hypothetical protein
VTTTDGHGQLAEAVPDRLHHAGAHPPQRGGEAVGVLRSRSRWASAATSGDWPAKSGWPPHHRGERVDAGAARGPSARSSSASRRAARSCARDPGARRDQDEAADEVRLGEREVQRDAPAHRVPASA